MVWHPELPIFASCSYDNSIKMYKEDGDDWTVVTTLTSHTNTVWDIAWDRTGDRLASCSEDTSVKIWQSYKPGNNENIQTSGTDPSWKCAATLSGSYNIEQIFDANTTLFLRISQ